MQELANMILSQLLMHGTSTSSSSRAPPHRPLVLFNMETPTPIGNNASTMLLHLLTPSLLN